MRGSLVIASKEVKVYVVSPIIYAVLVVFFGVSGFLFVSAMEYFALQCFQLMGYGATVNITRSVFTTQFHNMAILLLFLVPAITMRVFAEERKQRTMELLYSSPISSFELLLGKLLGVLAVIFAILAVTWYMPAFGEYLSTLDWGRILCSYLGLFLLSLCFVSMGIFASSLTENQIVAASIAFGLSILFWVLEWMGSNIGGTLGSVIFNLSLIPHLRSFSEGFLDTRDIVFYLSFSFFFLYLTWAFLERERLR